VDANDRALTAFAMLGHATFHTYELVIPVFVAIWSDAFTASPALLGIIAGVSYGLVGVGALSSGVLADRVGSKRLVLACLVGMGAAFGLVSVAPTLPVLAVALLLWGAAASIYHPAGLALLSRGAEVDSGTSDRLPGFLTDSRLLFTGGCVLVLVVGVLYGLYYRGAVTFLPEVLGVLPLFEPVELYGRAVEPSQYVYSGLLLLGGVGQYAGGWLVDRLPVERVLVGSYAALAAIAVVFVPAADAGLWPLLAVAAAFGFCAFLVAPVNQEAISVYSGADVRGLSFGYSYTAIFGVGAVGSSLAGLVLTRPTPAILFLLLAGLAGCAAVLGGVLLVLTARRVAPANPVAARAATLRTGRERPPRRLRGRCRPRPRRAAP
jgi:MFS family permease